MATSKLSPFNRTMHHNSDQIMSAIECDESDSLLCRIRECLAKLNAGNLEDRKSAASELIYAGIQERGEGGPRGWVNLPAPLRLPHSGIVKALEDHVSDGDAEVRRTVIRALGEWGDTATVRSLVKRLKRSLEFEPDIVRVSYILAIANIGGPEALNALACLCRTDKTETVRLTALQLLEELATRGLGEMVNRAGDEQFGQIYALELSAAVKGLDVLCHDNNQPDDLRYQAARTRDSLTASRN